MVFKRVMALALAAVCLCLSFSVSNTKSGLSSVKYRLKSVFTLTSSDGSSAALSNKVYNLESGKYRVKSVFEVTENGSTKTYTVYSTEKTVS